MGQVMTRGPHASRKRIQVVAGHYIVVVGEGLRDEAGNICDRIVVRAIEALVDRGKVKGSGIETTSLAGDAAGSQIIRRNVRAGIKRVVLGTIVAVATIVDAE